MYIFIAILKKPIHTAYLGNWNFQTFHLVFPESTGDNQKDIR